MSTDPGLPSGKLLAAIADAVSTDAAPGALKGYQQITSLSAATSLTIPSGATQAVVIPETQAVRFRDDGTNPTASVGFPLAVGQPWLLQGAAQLAAAKFIEQTASAKLNVLYYA